MVCASDRFAASLPSQRNIRSIGLRRDRNTSRCAKVEAASNFAGTIRTANPHTEAMLHHKQLQRMLEFRQTMEIFEKRIICRAVEKRPDTLTRKLKLTQTWRSHKFQVNNPYIIPKSHQSNRIEAGIYYGSQEGQPQK